MNKMWDSIIQERDNRNLNKLSINDKWKHLEQLGKRLRTKVKEDNKKMEKKNELKPKERYLTIQLLGKNGIMVSAFKNKERTGNQPHFTGNGVAVWINENVEKKPIPQSDDLSLSVEEVNI